MRVGLTRGSASRAPMLPLVCAKERVMRVRESERTAARVRVNVRSEGDAATGTKCMCASVASAHTSASRCAVLPGACCGAL